MTDDRVEASWGVLRDAHAALRSTAAAVTVDQLELPTPCADWSVAQVVQHAAGDQLAWASALTGGPGPAYDPSEPSGVLVEPPFELVDVAVAVNADAWVQVGDADEVPTPVPPFRMPLWLALRACAFDAGIHAWDLAVATGQPAPLGAEQAELLVEAAREFVEPMREHGFVAAPLEPVPDDDALAALLRHLGRRPDWTA